MERRGSCLSRRQFVLGTAGGTLGLLAGCTSRPAQGQPSSTVPRIGYLSAAPAGYPARHGGPHAEAFRQGLKQLGYVEGENLRVEYRFADLQFDRLPALSRRAGEAPVDVLVVGDTRSIQPARQATSTVPVVLVLTTDPVASGHVVSLARPGGNITGLTWRRSRRWASGWSCCGTPWPASLTRHCSITPPTAWPSAPVPWSRKQPRR